MADPPGTLPSSVQVAIVGAGAAGLVCARALAREERDVHVFEAGAALGGRMRTEVHRDGFLLDVGFHVLLTGYPSVRREVDLDRIDLRPFPSGCVVARGGKTYPLGGILDAARFPFASFGDKRRLGRLRSEDPGRTPDRTTLEHLRSLGFSSGIIETLFTPFFGGVFQDRSLSNSARFFASVLRAFMEGPAGIPAAGIGAVPAQIAEGIPAGAIHPGVSVEALRIEGGRVVGLTVSGREIRAEAIVLACGASETARLAEVPLPEMTMRGVTVVYFAAKQPPTEEKRLFVRGDAEGATNHFAVLSHAVPTLAPKGSHLLMGAILGTPDGHDGEIAEIVRGEMAWWFPHGLTHTWRWLRTFKIPAAQWAFPPGMADRLPTNRTGIGNLYVAGDITREPTLDGAIASGIEAARILLGG